MKPLEYLNSALRREHKVGKSFKRTLKQVHGDTDLTTKVWKMMRVYRILRRLRKVLSPINLEV